MHFGTLCNCNAVFFINIQGKGDGIWFHESGEGNKLSYFTFFGTSKRNDIYAYILQGNRKKIQEDRTSMTKQNLQTFTPNEIMELKKRSMNSQEQTREIIDYLKLKKIINLREISNITNVCSCSYEAKLKRITRSRWTTWFICSPIIHQQHHWMISEVLNTHSPEINKFSPTR